jgi:hypothetical protein
MPAGTTHERARLLGRVVVVLAGFSLVADTGFSDADGCLIAAEHGGMLFPVDRLDPSTRCLIGPVVNEFTTSGLVGPVQTPIGQDFFEYLLDRPVLLAALVERLQLGDYKFTVRGDGQYWVDDGEGTQGLLTLVYRDETARIYHIDGYHEGKVLPQVKARAVVFLRLAPGVTPEGHPSVESKLFAYTKLKDSFLAALVRMLRPLVGGTVTRKLSRGFEVTTQLGNLIAQDPDRVAREADALDGIDGAELKTLHAFLHAVPPPVAPPPPQRATP